MRGKEEDWGKWIRSDNVKLVNLGTYGWEGKEINVGGYMSKEIYKIIYLGKMIGNVVEPQSLVSIERWLPGWWVIIIPLLILDHR